MSINNNSDYTFQYYTHQEAEQYAYYSIPKELFTNSKYKHISTDAKLLYGLLRDRNQLSLKNNWVDSEGHIYIIFTRDEAMEILGFKKDYIAKIFKELSTVNLIKDVKQGLNKPNIIYVGKIAFESKENQWKAISPLSRQRQNRVQESVDTATNNTNINNTDNSNKSIVSPTYINNPEPKETDRPTDSPTIQNEIQTILSNAQVELYDAKLFIKSVITKLYTDSTMPEVLKMGLKQQDIRDRLRCLTNRAIDIALIKLKGVKTNKEIYFMKCLLTAIVEVDLEDFILQDDDE